jgi:shikimate kinase
VQKNNLLFFLWGMMGSGKSYWAYHLSKKLSLNYVDTDNLIEHKMQLTTSQIFEKFGESFFREKENLALQELIKNTSTPTIVATGGGLPCFFNNAQIMNQHGISFFFKYRCKNYCRTSF